MKIHSNRNIALIGLKIIYYLLRNTLKKQDQSTFLVTYHKHTYQLEAFMHRLAPVLIQLFFTELIRQMEV